MITRRTARSLAWLAIPLAAATLLAQYALDANLQVGGGRVNPTAGYSMPMQPDLYRVNRNTGNITYDRQAAIWSPRTYNVREQQQLMSSGVMDANSYARPIATGGPDSRMYAVNRRPGTYRYNNPNSAFVRDSYSVYQSAAPPPAAQRPIEVGDATPTYRPARSGQGYAGRTGANYLPPVPVGDGYQQVRTAGPAPAAAPGAKGSYTNLTPQVYRPPYVRLPAGDD